MRSYLPAGHPDKEREIGSEPTPDEFVATMVAVFREVRRVLRDDGFMWVNLGDSYANDEKRGGSTGGKHVKSLHGNTGIGRQKSTTGTPAGNQLLMPHRVALALQADGWVLRDTVIWSKRCLSGGAVLYARTQKGDSPSTLKDLVRLDPKTVKLWDGEKWVQVLGWSKVPSGERDHLEIELRSGERIGCTKDHRWPTDRGVLYANELQVGDVLKKCRLPEPESVEPLCLPDAEFGWLVGFYLAEGFRTEKGCTFSIHSDETEAAGRIQALARLVGGTATIQQRKGKSSVVVVYSKTLAAFIHEYVSGSTCHNKRLTRKAWMRGDAFLQSLLDGYLEGDGHWDANRGFHVLGFTYNRGFAADLRCLCARLGLVCRLRQVKHKCGDKEFLGYRGRIRQPSSHWNAKPNTEIVAIRKSKASDFWDVSVDQEPNLFAFASGVLTHNSPMPSSQNGVRWERCRVKVGREAVDWSKAPKGWDCGEGAHDAMAHGNYRQNENREKTVAKWSPCPGCPKCEKNGGYVLRRGQGRTTTAHEYLFLFTKGNGYFWDMENCREDTTEGSKKRFANGVPRVPPKKFAGMEETVRGGMSTAKYVAPSRIPRSVWTLSSEPTKFNHFATYPSELVRRCLLPLSPRGCCPECGAQWAPVVEGNASTSGQKTWAGALARLSNDRSRPGNFCDAEHKVLGYRPTCTCTTSAGPVACRVLDPFSGTGTTGQTACFLGHDYVGVELNPEYAAFAEEWILKEPRWSIRKRKPVPKRQQTTDGQRVLFS